MMRAFYGAWKGQIIIGYIPYGFMQKQTGIFIEPHQAKVVKQIYQRYLAGDSLEGIADFLFQEGIPSPHRKDRWTRPVINSLLSNQKYIGYIIDFADFYMVQGEKGRRSNIDEDTGKRKAARYSSQNVLSGLLVCAECGANYRRITRPSGAVVWRCANRVENGNRANCHAPSIPEIELQDAICEMLDWDTFDPETVKNKLESIRVTPDGALHPVYTENPVIELFL